jgi:hypothetical protein
MLNVCLVFLFKKTPILRVYENFSLGKIRRDLLYVFVKYLKETYSLCFNTKSICLIFLIIKKNVNFSIITHEKQTGLSFLEI